MSSISVLPTLLTGESNETSDKYVIRVVLRNNAPDGINIVDAAFILTAGDPGHSDLQHLEKKSLGKDEETNVMFQIDYAPEGSVRLEYQIRFQIGNGPLREDEGGFCYKPETRTFTLVTGNGPLQN